MFRARFDFYRGIILLRNEGQSRQMYLFEICIFKQSLAIFLS